MFNILSFQSDQHGMVAGLYDAEYCRATILTSTTEESPSCFYCRFYLIYVSISVKPAAKWEADHSPPSSFEVKNVWIFTSTSPHLFMMWCLTKQCQCRLLLPFVFCRNKHVVTVWGCFLIVNCVAEWELIFFWDCYNVVELL